MAKFSAEDRMDEEDYANSWRSDHLKLEAAVVVLMGQMIKCVNSRRQDKQDIQRQAEERSQQSRLAQTANKSNTTSNRGFDTRPVKDSRRVTVSTIAN